MVWIWDSLRGDPAEIPLGGWECSSVANTWKQRLGKGRLDASRTAVKTKPSELPSHRFASIDLVTGLWFMRGRKLRPLRWNSPERTVVPQFFRTISASFLSLFSSSTTTFWHLWGHRQRTWVNLRNKRIHPVLVRRCANPKISWVEKFVVYCKCSKKQPTQSHSHRWLSHWCHWSSLQGDGSLMSLNCR